MKARADTIARGVINLIHVSSKPRPVSEWISDLWLESKFTEYKTIADENGEKYAKAVNIYLRRELTVLIKLGRIARFGFNSSSPYMLQGSAFIEPADTIEVLQWKERRGRLDEYTETLRSLNPRQFEFLCGGILELLGVENAHVTKYSDDQGIDFYGRLKLEKLFDSKFRISGVENQLGIWMIGQAKHYQKGKVSTFEIRNLVGAVELAKSNTFSSSDIEFKGLDLRACDPIYYLFFTTGQMTADSWQLFQRSGVVGMDGDMVAAFLADHNVGIKSEQFDAETFWAWLSYYSSI